ncbi:MAG: GAF domain-containing protein, partial [Acidobacteria bacterium]|nr:GAF domain-containing protein [Acidobacteriota bacterium]
MSANLNNARAGWASSSATATAPFSESGREADRNALQALLAFACIHEQAARRRFGRSDPAPSSPEEEFALHDVLELVATRALAVTGADGVAIALAEQNAIVCRASAGNIAPPTGVKLDPTSGFSGACLRGGHTVRCDDAENDPRVNAQASRALGARSMVAVPLTAKQRVIGLIEAFSSETFGFNDSDVRSLNLLGELILAAIRPEEEERLATLAVQIGSLANQTSPRPSPTAPAPARPAPRIIVDEKFAPSATPGAEAVQPPADPPPEQVLPAAEANLDSTTPTLGLSQTSLSISGIVLLAGLIMVAIGLALAVWSRIRHAEQAISANSRIIVHPSISNKDSRDI